MKIETGKYYRTRDGRKVGHAKLYGDRSDNYPFNVPIEGKFYAYTEDGKSCLGIDEDDLISEWTDEPETGTLAELKVKPGDVVEFVSGEVKGFDIGHRYACEAGKDGFGREAVGPINVLGGCIPGRSAALEWRIISRASDTPKTWGEMTDAEKGALLLKFHDGANPQSCDSLEDEWIDDPYVLEMGCEDQRFYRAEPEPKRETVTIEGWVNGVNDAYFDTEDSFRDIKDLRITFDVVDGKPDCSSVRMEEV